MIRLTKENEGKLEGHSIEVHNSLSIA